MMKFARAWVALCAVLAASAGARAWAGEAIVYGPAPSWVRPVELPKPKDVGGAVDLMLQDAQINFGTDSDDYYVDTALKVLNATGLQGAGQVGAVWDPSLQTLTIHRLELIRDGKTIDLLAGPDKFLVLRRENNLSRAMLDGRLTANKQIEDLRVGDIVRFSYSVKGRDPAMAGHSEDVSLWFGKFQIDHVHLRAVWPKSKPMRIKTGAPLGEFEPKAAAQGMEFVFEKEDFTPPIGPADAPARFAVPGRIEMSDFADWKALSATIAPLYAQISTLKPDSPLKAEIDRIRAANREPLARMQAALKLVQEQVRYVYLDEGVGGYTPAAPDLTWSRKFGDCKGKTALLISLLRALDIEAAPVLVNSNGSDGLDKALPRMGAFDHVLVRARVAGKTYWLDGTMLDQRLTDLERPPNLEFGLPLTAGGSPLQELTAAVPAAPLDETLIELDASAGLWVEGPVKVQIIWRGPIAVAMRAQLQESTKAQLEKAFKDSIAESYDWIKADSAEIAEQADGSVRATLLGKGKGAWNVDDKTRAPTWYANTTAYLTSFDARTEGVDRDAPYALTFPKRERYVTRVKLPRGGTGFALAGDDVDATVANIHLVRKSKLDGEWATIEFEVANVAPEVKSAEALAANDKFKALPTGEYVGIRAPRDLRMTSKEADAFAATTTDKAEGLLQLGLAKEKADDVDGARKDYDSAVEADPKSRARYFRAALEFRQGQSAAALADLDSLIADHPKEGSYYIQKAQFLMSLRRETDAVKALVAAESAGATDANLLPRRAYLRWRTHDPEAKDDIAAALKADPDNAIVKLMAVVIDLPVDQSSAALSRQTVDRLIPLMAQSPSAEGYAYLGQNQTVLRDFAAAARSYDRAIAIEDRPAYHASRAEARLGAGDKTGALADYDALVKLEPSKASFSSRAYFKYRQKDYAGAEKDYVAAVAIDPEDIEMQSNRIQMVRLAGDGARADRLWDELLAAKPGSALLRLGRARDYVGQKAYDKALSELDAGLSRAKDRDERLAIFQLRQSTLESLKRYDEALAVIDQVVVEAPDNSMGYNNRCWLKATRNLKLETAVADCDKALQIDPRNFAALDSRGLAHLRVGQFEASITDYDAALGERPGQPSSLFGRALAKAKLGDQTGASADRAAALKADPKVAEEFAGYGLN
jgi:tetratricopeptide (TPR) repeat protein